MRKTVLRVITSLVLSLAFTGISYAESITVPEGELGYRYRISFKVDNHEIGPSIVHIYTNTWVYNPNHAKSYSADAYVLLANPHSDMEPLGDGALVLVMGCSLFTGKGTEIIEQLNPDQYPLEKRFLRREANGMTVVHDVTIHDFVEPKQYKINVSSNCRSKKE